MMDNHKVHHRINPRLNANILSKLFYCWILPYLHYGSKHELETKDILRLAPNNQSELLGDLLEKCWKNQVQEAQRKECRPSFLKVIVKTFGCKYLKCATISVAATFTIMLLPLVLKLLISHFYENSTSTMLETCSYVFLFMSTMTVDLLLSNHSKRLMCYIGGQVKTACSSLIYRKLLRLQVNSRDRSDGGRTITLLSNDVAQFEEAFLFLHVIFVLSVIIILNSFLMWKFLGITTVFAVLIVTLLNIPTQVYAASVVTRLRQKAAQRTDRRLVLIDEIINGIRVIKMYTWEKSFEKLVHLARRKELDIMIKKVGIVIVLGTFARYAASISLYLTIAILINYEDKITSLIMFPLIHYNFEMNVQAGFFLGGCLKSLANVTAAVNRIEDYLLLEEVMPFPKLYDDNKTDVVALKNVSLSWSENEETDVLRNISISIQPNKLYALVGEIGSGKSTLLKVILGELKSKSGQVLNYGEVVFASQEPWLFNGSIRSNILLGAPFNEDKYNAVISSCALLKDFEQLPHGDKTIVGERGAALSGGQSARINLARAVYIKADVYLLDDPLASIDYSVSEWLFDKCINGLLKDKARVLVTQKLEYIKKVDEIILINDGRLKYQGDYENFRKTGFFQYLSRNCEIDPTPKDAIDGSISSGVDVNDFQKDEFPEPQETEELLRDCKESVRLKQHELDPEENIEPIKRGKIPLSLLKEFYINKILVMCTLIFMVICQCCIGTFDYLVATWSRNQDNYYASTNFTNSNHLDKKLYFSSSQITLFYVIGGIVVGIIISLIIKLLLFIKLHRVSCQRLHSNMISSLIRTATEFFDNNDSGRILNRFSQDLGVVDERLPINVLKLATLFAVLFVAIVQVIIANRYMSISVIVSLFFAYRTFMFFGKSIWTTKRLEARAKALVLSHSNATFNGLITIRASGAQKMLQNNFNLQQDNYMAAYFTNIDIYYAFALWVEIIMKSFSVFAAFAFIFLKSTGISGATVGYVMFQMFLINRRVAILAEFITRFDLSMISTERTLEYTKLEDENITEKNCHTIPASTWPSEGRIKFDHLYLKYSNSIYPVLKNINFIIEPKTKVGIIGRTGAGKSSLLTALFRLAETQGSLVIDGINTNTVALKDLRSKISILPQKSILFSTSLRNNVDPLGLYDDAKIWSALKCVQLGNIFHSLDEELDQKSLSGGQRQLLCLTRAILKNNKILILDEATANMDARTDDLINNTIKENFNDSTVLTISHKLNSVIDCDKVLVIDAGQVIEYDEPEVLLQQENGYFYKMWKALNNLSL